VLATYTYDAFDRRIGVREGSATRWTLYDGSAPILDFNGSGTQTARYLNGPPVAGVDAVLARETSGGTVAWYLQDRLGTVRDIVNNSGAVIDHVDYNAFGGVVNETAPAAGDRFRFAGVEYDHVIDDNLSLERINDPHTGRWLSQDPSKHNGNDSNFYRYCTNDPINLTDSFGLQPTATDIGQAIGKEILLTLIRLKLPWPFTGVGLDPELTPEEIELRKEEQQDAEFARREYEAALHRVACISFPVGAVGRSFGVGGFGGGGALVGATGSGSIVIGGGRVAVGAGDIVATVLALSMGDGGGGGAADEDPELVSDRIGQIAAALGKTRDEIRAAIHQVKRNMPRGGPIRNPDVCVNLRTGEVYPKTGSGGIGDSIGNIFDYLNLD
jgi:RHS repeat-associated protein